MRLKTENEEMTLPEVLKIAVKNSNVIFTRKFYIENGFNPIEDTYRVNIKGRINKALKEYDPYNSVTFHTDHLVAEDWMVITKEEIYEELNETKN